MQVANCRKVGGISITGFIRLMVVKCRVGAGGALSHKGKVSGL